MNGSKYLRRLGRLGLLGGVAAVVAVVGVACGSDDDGGNGGSEGGGSAAAATLDDRGYAEGHRLVTTAWLEDRLDDDSIVVIDLRREEDYLAGHIPGAVRLASLSRTDENGVSGQIGTREQVAQALSDAGVTPESTVVLYDANTSLSPARTLWVLDVYGHAETRILDGAFTTWEAEGRATSTEGAEVTPTEYVFSGVPNEAIIAGYDELIAAIDDPEALVCDVRSAEEYAGRDVRSDQGGHVPGAVNEDWRQAVNESGHFKTADELRGIYDDTLLVSDDTSTVYVYCQTGVRAAHTWFVLSELLGLENVKNYDGSWEEWGNRPDAPIDRS
ncbi:MAG: sulfurtransferase [Dehalococcoidia bacterium]|nr:sulfurtransferase [Dehalococcoidia bacterium]